MMFESMVHEVIRLRDDMRKSVCGTDGALRTEEFLGGDAEGKCPYCRCQCECVGADEGPGSFHELERTYTCPKCGVEFSEVHMCIPVYFTVKR